MKAHFFLLFFFLFIACNKYNYKKNAIAELSIINLTSSNNISNISQKKLAYLLQELDKVSPKAILIKPIFQNVDTTFLHVLKKIKTPLYSSASVHENQQNKNTPNEDLYFRKSNLLLKRSFRYITVPNKILLPFLKGIGVEAATFRNSGQLESYYIAVAINGKAYASVPYLIVADILKTSINDINPTKLFLSQYGTMPIRYSLAGSAYQTFEIDTLLSQQDFPKQLKNQIVILAYGNEKIPTLAGAKSKAEITADVINQLFNQIQ